MAGAAGGHGGSGGDGGTTVFWREQLNFPWWFAGRLGEMVAKPILSWVWRRNLANLARLVDALTVGPRAAAHRERAGEVGELARREDGLALTVEALTA